MHAWLGWTLAAAVTVSPATTRAIEGPWSGALETGGTRLRLVLHLTARPHGGLAARLDSPDQAALHTASPPTR